MVWLDASWVRNPKPTIDRQGIAMASWWLKANSMSPTANKMQPAATRLLNALVALCIARKVAANKAPAPEEAIRNPRVVESPRNIWLAKTGIKVTYGMPNALTTASSSKV